MGPGYTTRLSKNRNYTIPYYSRLVSESSKPKTFLMCAALTILSPTVNAWGMSQKDFLDAIADAHNVKSVDTSYIKCSKCAGKSLEIRQACLQASCGVLNLQGVHL